ncbi:hypothetical protein SDC9_189196 [bioreactor metagenome]|uniref:Uncharacterized protein n=1 Tax=bioreactor metagenome TaxID=1076179 RepID=A0A645HT47_9ZZZZ
MTQPFDLSRRYRLSVFFAGDVYREAVRGDVRHCAIFCDEDRDGRKNNDRGGEEIPVHQQMGRRSEAELLRDRHRDAVYHKILACDEKIRSEAGVARRVGDRDADPGVLAHCLVHGSADGRRGDDAGIGGEVRVYGDKGQYRHDRPLRGLEDGALDESLHQA